MVGIGKASAGVTTRCGLGLRGMAAAALLVAMLGLGGCSTWDSVFGDDEPASQPGAAGTTMASASGGSNADRFPNLARVPPRPVEMSANNERRQALDNLAADRANARYTDEELRARPADTNTPPPAPRAPVTPMPSASQTALPRGAVEPQAATGQSGATQSGATQYGATQAAPTLQPPRPTQTAQAPQAAPQTGPARAANVGDTYSQFLAQSGGNTLPAGLTQAQPGTSYSPVALPGAQQLLAVVRFGNGASGLGNDDKALIKKVAEYYKGVGNKGNLKVVAYGAPAASGLSQRRSDNIVTELRKHGVGQVAATTSPAPAAYAAGAADDYSRRAEIYLVN